VTAQAVHLRRKINTLRSFDGTKFFFRISN
jgi:hypothetical protein